MFVNVYFIVKTPQLEQWGGRRSDPAQSGSWASFHDGIDLGVVREVAIRQISINLIAVSVSVFAFCSQDDH